MLVEINGHVYRKRRYKIFDVYDISEKELNSILLPILKLGLNRLSPALKPNVLNLFSISRQKIARLITSVLKKKNLSIKREINPAHIGDFSFHIDSMTGIAQLKFNEILDDNSVQPYIINFLKV